MTKVSVDAKFTTRSRTAPKQSLDRSTSSRLRAKELAGRLLFANERIRQLEVFHQTFEQELAWAQQQLDVQKQSAAQPSPAPMLERDRPLPGHQFGTRLIALCIELAKRVGFRATEYTIKTFFEMLGLDMKTPSHDAIEQWTLRLGVGELADTFTKDQRVIWMADHSSQIGKEKVLLIIGMLVEDLPLAGETLDMEKLKVLSIVPGQSWKKEDVAREYNRLAAEIGAPCYLICDGAIELREPAENLEKDGENTIVLRDLKHYAANLLEKQIGRGERFKAFLTEVGLTRNRVQQTELSHFAPPQLKQKSRFMNLESLLGWATMVLHHLDHPESASRDGITTERMEEKLGWLRGFAEDLLLWSDSQEVINLALAWINRQGLCDNSSDQLQTLLAPWLAPQAGGRSPAGEIATSLLQYVIESQQKLPAGERAWLSTEILESLFGRFKRIERQHSKGGFTRLLAALPTLCCRVDAERIRDRFAKVKSGDLQQWIKKTLPNSLTARRNAAYRLARVS